MAHTRKDWTATAIIKNRLNGLKLFAVENHRSVGHQLDYLLEECGVLTLTDAQYQSAINKLHKSEKKK